MNYKIQTTFKKLLADTHTPVGVYLRVRDRFEGSLLLESADYRGGENSFSFICCGPLAGIRAADELLTCYYPGGKKQESAIRKGFDLVNAVTGFLEAFELKGGLPAQLPSGLFGYTGYDAVKHFEEIDIKQKQGGERIPDIMYHLYRYVIAFDHFRDELYLVENRLEGEAETLGQLESLIVGKAPAPFAFSRTGDEAADGTAEDFLEMVQKGKEHCRRGDVFQLVLSRAFSHAFKGDEFNVYRALRSVNPSPYLFYFDYGYFRIFGSSPEAQITVKNGRASLNPIAGTFRRTGNDEADTELALKLKNDPKENAEHVMLVDLARNDLGRNSSDVKVEKFREVQYYSHVIHLVSNVSGKLRDGIPTMKAVADSFPAGTLSGAPKHRAMQLIDTYEKSPRGFYGGGIGYMGFNGDFNHAIMIRSFMSRDNTLHYRAGAGVVESSSEEGELKEVDNKLAALRAALELAEKL